MSGRGGPPDFSIIIPFQAATRFLDETLDHIGRMRGAEFEVLLLPDEPMEDPAPNHDFPIRCLATGAVSPARKRDLGARESRGRFLAFIDDDAYPAPDWLAKVAPYFEQDNVAGVGGPQLTAPDDGFWARVSGAVYMSPLNGRAACRYVTCSGLEHVDDWPSVNLIVRASDFLEAGGFDSHFWPGEDTILCLRLTHELKKILCYAPGARVFHHRRASLAKHLRQAGNYGLHRGYFAKRFPANSRRVSYFLPSLFFLFAVLGWSALLPGKVPALLYAGLWALYAAALLASLPAAVSRTRSAAVALCSLPLLAVTHFWYGFQFLRGFLFTSNLQSTLGR